MDSTNNYAMARALEGTATHGTLIFAREQWAGKGQRGRTWITTPGENIILSAVLEPVAIPVSFAFGLSAAVALACHDLFTRYTDADAVTIKWPNDLYWNDRKAGGILIENHFKGDRWLFAIAGMGININQQVFSTAARNPVSLGQITGRSFNVVALSKELGHLLELRYGSLVSDGAAALIQEYNGRLYRRHMDVRLKKDSAVFTTRIEGVSMQGQLLTRDVLDRQFNFGEVEWLVPDYLL